MGRGRAKAKQTKVARRLKYQQLDTDFDALQRELGTDGNGGEVTNLDEDDDEEYSRYLADEDDERRRHAG
ncbi:DUF3073 domain-containing protein [Jiangella gansuensis]|uniref:DUF3073 domain-containing protein n=1 Tax=Jiangella gansuensis TaxID=281473 RepID=UPI00047CF0AC|nr:DUF3073 domain-containing protein [Jiangella gansuensis]